MFKFVGETFSDIANYFFVKKEDLFVNVPEPRVGLEHTMKMRFTNEFHLQMESKFPEVDYSALNFDTYVDFQNRQVVRIRAHDVDEIGKVYTSVFSFD